jgi:hypothetical protein
MTSSAPADATPATKKGVALAITMSATQFNLRPEPLARPN